MERRKKDKFTVNAALNGWVKNRALHHTTISSQNLSIKACIKDNKSPTPLKKVWVPSENKKKIDLKFLFYFYNYSWKFLHAKSEFYMKRLNRCVSRIANDQSEIILSIIYKNTRIFDECFNVEAYLDFEKYTFSHALLNVWYPSIYVENLK